jgi:hypothetical protein
VGVPTKEKELLALRNDLGDNWLLIAAGKGRPDTLKFFKSAVALIFPVIDEEMKR